MAQKDENVRQVTKRGGGQGSRGDQDQPAEIEQTSKVSTTIHVETIPREERLEKFREAEAAPIQAEKVKPKIQRVPFMLRQDTKFEKYYEPRVAAVGPFHHARKPTYKHAEKIKLKLAANFVKDSKQNDADLLKKVEDNINFVD
ncbi:uncharacterized protein LOC110770441 [Prunus avium]|uniref:Uncharacterized protein LOC110770441 n=1 Tax=Prunus avium TaxID=42229 RepID=A0A6P5TT63_PRUAV|nr:uncharacterized protein LOC110770441 [Prunus avium]